MRSQLLFLLAAVTTVGILLFDSTPQAAAAARAPQLAAGHLIVQLEGSVQRLEVTWITPKPDAHNPRKLDSRFQLCQLDRNGSVVDRQPIDLSRFNLDPNKPGLRVEGCDVIDSKIVTICNIPYRPETFSLELRNGRKVIGSLNSDGYFKLLREGQNR